MRLLPVILLLSLAAHAQPSGYTAGTQVCWTLNSRDHGYFRASGWSASTDHILVFFGGVGQTTCANYDGMQPGLFLRDGAGGSNWNGVTNLPAEAGGGSRKWMVFIMTDQGNQPNVYRDDINFFLENSGVTLNLAQMRDEGRLHIAGGSAGPGNAQAYLNASGNTYATYFSTGIWMTTTLTTASANIPDKNYCWYAENDNPVGTTPPSATINFFNQCPGAEDVDKFLDFTPGGDHSNTTWGDCMDISGTNNRWTWMIIKGENLIPDPVYPADHQININGSMVYDVTGAAHKPNQLFDGDTASLVFENNLNGYILSQTNGQLAWIVLDSFYTHPKVAALKRNLPGGGGTVDFTFYYNWTDTTRHSNTFTATLADGQWKFADSVNSRAYADSSRLVLMRIPSGASDKFSEVRIYGVTSGVAPSIFPAPAADPPDEGKYFMGYNKVHTDNNLDDAGYSLRANTDLDYVDSTTSGTGGTFTNGKYYVFNRFANSIPLSYQPAADSGRKIFPYFAGPRLAFKFPNLSNDSKDIPIGSDSTDINNWVYTYHLYYAMVGKLGHNASVNMTGYTFNNATPGFGLGLIDEIEVGNEDMGRWKDKGFHRPGVLILKLKQGYDGAKAADPNIKVISGAMTGIDTSWFKGLYMSNLLRFQTKTMPMDVVAVNEYATNAGGQHVGPSRGISPEEFQLYERGQGLISVIRRHKPGAPVYLTEFGWDTHDGSSFVVPDIPGQTRDETKGNFELRAMEEAAAAGFSKYYHYTHKTIGGGDFGTTGISYDIFIQQRPIDTLPAYMMSVLTPSQQTGTNQWLTLPLPLYWYMTCRAYTLKDYKAKPTMEVKGDSTGLWRMKYDHVSNGNKKVYSVFMGSVHNSTVSNHTFTVPTAVSAKMFTPTVGNRLGTETNLSVVAGVITVPTVSEKTQYIEVTLDGSNQSPTAVAGNDQTITLPTNQVTVNGSSSSDPDGTISTYAWTKISGPATYTITSASSASTTITGLVAGTYVFSLTVTDNGGATGTDDITITVNAAPVSNRGNSFKGSLKNKFRN